MASKPVCTRSGQPCWVRARTKLSKIGARVCPNDDLEITTKGAILTNAIITDASLADPNVSSLIVSVARALCFARGDEPDNVVWNQQTGAIPRWRLALVDAQAAVRAVEAHLRNETFAVTDHSLGSITEPAVEFQRTQQTSVARWRDVRLERLESMVDAIHTQTVVWLPQVLETLRGVIQGESNPAMQRLAADMERALLTIVMEASSKPAKHDVAPDT